MAPTISINPVTNTAIYGYGSSAYIEDIEEDGEVATQKAIEIDGAVYTCDVITKASENYLKLKSLTPAGYGIGSDANTKLASVRRCRGAGGNPDCVASWWTQ